MEFIPTIRKHRILLGTFILWMLLEFVLTRYWADIWHWIKFLVEKILDLLNYPNKDNGPFEAAQRTINIYAWDKSFGDLLFVWIATWIAVWTWRANTKSAEVATLALEEFRPKISFSTDSNADSWPDYFTLVNKGSFDAYCIKVFFKRSNSKAFETYELKDKFISSDNWKTKIEIKDRSIPISCIVTYRNASTDRTYCYATNVLGQNKKPIGYNGEGGEWLLNVMAYEQLLKLTSLKNQIDSNLKSDDLDVLVFKFLQMQKNAD